MKVFRRIFLPVLCVCILLTACLKNNEVRPEASGNRDAELDAASAGVARWIRPITGSEVVPSPNQYMVHIVPPAAIDHALLDAFDESLRYDLLYPYYPIAEDSYGGFVEDRGSTWRRHQNNDKYVVAQARYTWTAAKASLFYADDPPRAAIYRNSAAVGFEFLTRMWGQNYDGLTGIALMSDRDGSNGRVGDKEDLVIYGHAFAIYAAAAYFEASGEPAALDFAVDGYNFLDDYGHDSTYGGYYVTASNTVKDTNVNLHVLEALTALYHVMPTSHTLSQKVASRINELLVHLHDDAIHCESGTDCFAYPVMDRDWTATGNSVSFGHDVELAFLMVDAMVTLGQNPLNSPFIKKIKNMVDFTFTHAGYRSDGGLYYAGTFSDGSITVTENQLTWWTQAEGLGALCMMRMLVPGDPFYSDTMSLTWHFIENQIIDQSENGWVRKAGDWSATKAFEWHSNYHNSRALMNCLRWLSDDCEDADEDEDGVCDHCGNSAQDESETDLNCGGICNPCASGLGCLIDADCESNFCNGSVCTRTSVLTCEDGVQNCDETGADKTQEDPSM